ncbi:hypothetical protein TRVA0_006S02080 [Trichomonascus vanleenenianus]|uniref:uncharacterized protein n=1 Tax=Trichomonascus vanleenenianus TaxID=2268995 RepID=UPI003ECB90A6
MAIRLTSDLFQPQRTLLSQFGDINYDESFEVSSYATAAEFQESNNLPEHMNCLQMTNIPASSDSGDTVVHTPKVVLRFRELLSSLVKAIDDVEIHIDAPKWRFAGDIMELGSIIEELWGLMIQVDKSAKEGNWLPLFIRRVFPLISSDFKNSDMLLLLVAYWLSSIGPELSIPSEEYYLFVTEVYPIFIAMVKKESSIAKIVLLHLYAKMKITSELVATVINCRTRDHEFYAEDSVPMRCTRIIWINILLYRLSNFEVFSGSWTLIEKLQQELDRIIKEEPNATVSSEFFRYPGRHGDTYVP